MSINYDEKCFRCRGVNKIMINIKIDDNSVRLCGNCYRDFTLFFEGYVVNPMVKYTDMREAKE